MYTSNVDYDQEETEKIENEFDAILFEFDEQSIRSNAEERFLISQKGNDKSSNNSK